MNPHSLLKKRELGAYYTPPELSQILANWAITKPTDNILEPSFGGCGFFDSCINRLNELECDDPSKQLYGVDIDSHAFDILSDKFKTYVSLDNRFIQNDFIQVEPKDFLVQEFDVVIGNPPYVSMHNMTSKQRATCDKVLKESPFASETMGRNASLWAFFILHSLSFLREGGKAAWVLPSSLMHADYAKKLTEIYKHHFKHIKIIKLAERFFIDEGAEEISVVLVAEGFSKEANNNCDVAIRSIDTLDELSRVIYAYENTNSVDMDYYKLGFVSEQTKKTYQEITNKPFAKPSFHYFDIRIGMVTGANKYFIVDKKTIEKNELPENVLQPVVGRFKSLIGIKHHKHRHKQLQREGHRTYLVNPTKEQMRAAYSKVAKYLSQITEEEKAKNRTFKKRPHWFAPDYGIDSLIPDAFMSYMIHRGPRLVVNQGKLNCTNSIHKVFFHDKKTPLKVKLAVAVSMLSTYSQFSAELEGRAYSSGVLKIEPSAGKKVKILLEPNCIDELNTLVPEIETALRSENHTEVARLVDDVLIKHNLLNREECQHLIDGVHALRRERYKGVKSYNE